MSDLSQRIAALPRERLDELLARLGQAKRAAAGPEELPIRPRERGSTPLPLSFSQERLWFLDQLDPGSPDYDMAAAIELRGKLDVVALERSLGEVVRRHESLRTTFAAAGGQPVQVIAPALAVELPRADLRRLPADLRKGEVARLSREAAHLSFDLARGPLFRFCLLGLSGEEHVLLLTFHHIVTDGWSTALFVREVADLYVAFLEGRPSPLPEPPIQYPDFALWQREHLRMEVLARLVDYWRGQLAGTPVLELPVDRPRLAVQSRRGANRLLELTPALTARLRDLAQAEGATLFMVLLAGFDTLLQRYAGQEDFAVGTYIANRNRTQVEGLIGFFVNNLALRARFAPELPFRQLLARVREVTVGAFAHQDLPFERLLEELQPPRSASHTPIFQVMLVLQNTPRMRLELPGLSMSRVNLGTEQSNFDLTLWMEEAEGVTARVEYAADLFDGATVDRLGGHFLTLLAAVAGDPERRLRELPLLTPVESEQLARWAVSVTGESGDACVHDLFAARAAARPEAAALVVDGVPTTYRELDERSERLARRLRGLGVGPEVVVGLAVEPASEAAAAMLGVLRAGGAFLPLDPSYPTERLAFMLADAGARVLVTQERFAPRFAAAEVPRVMLDADLPAAGREAGRAAAGPEHLAYVIYTSGSTGRPKGVAVTHGNLMPMMAWGCRCFDLGERTRVLQNLSYGFDFGAFEILTTLIAGGELHVLSRRGDFRASAAWIAARRIDTLHTTPSFCREIVASGERLDSLEIVHLGGEPLTRETVERIFAAVGEGCRVFNGYGPTEVTVNSTIFELSRRSPRREATTIPIGRPTARNSIYVVNRWGAPAPAGVPGELWIGGDGVARGYLGRPDLTAAKFVPDPFGAAAGGRLYRTGDLVRFLASGDLEFLGRIDHQVKIRGYRVELEEIEAVLARHRSVREAVAAVREDAPGDQRLVAYVVPAPGERPSAADLRAHLEAALPAHMVPSAVVFLDALPLTGSGKVDRRALPAPVVDRPELVAVFVGPRTPAEEVVVGIWAEVLGVARVGIHDGFFDLGGHSLLATRVLARVREALGVEVPLHAFFEALTVAELALRVEERRQPEVPPIRPVPREGELPLSFAQERLWFLEQLRPGQAAYYVPRVLRIDGVLDVSLLARAYGALASRHEILRTTVSEVDGHPVQRIHPARPFHLPLVDLRALPTGERGAEVERLRLVEGQRRFELVRDTMLRATALRLGECEHLLLQTEHHLAHDGWAQGVLLRDLLELYRALGAGRPPVLPPLPVQYADFAAWQREWLTGELLDGQLAFWRRQLAGAPAVLPLPTDRPRPPVQTSRGAERIFAVPADLAESLRALARHEGVTLFMATLAVFDVLLHRYSGETDLVVGSGVANRRRPETEGMIGMIVNTLVLRADLSGRPAFRELLGRVRRVCLDAYAHQDLPFDKLVEALRPKRSLSHAPIFQVLFAFNDAPTPELEVAGLRIEEVHSHNRSAKFDLLLVASPQAEQRSGLGLRSRTAAFNLALEYNVDLFERPTVERLLSHYASLLRAAVDDPSRRIAELSLLAPAERHQLLAEWSGVRAPYPADLCIHEVFTAAAARTPQAVALVCGAERTSYGELEQQASRLGRRLQRAGVGPEAVVAIFAERSPALVMGMLAVLKAGGAYMVLDPADPLERLRRLLDDARVRMILADERLASRLPEHGAEVVPLSPAGSAGEEPPAQLTSPENLAYVIYTSGSTGRPKGVSVPHRGVIRLVCAGGFARLGPQEVFLQLSPASFDACVLEIWGCLLNGGRLVVPPAGPPTLERLGEMLRDHGVTTLWLTAGLFHLMVDERLDDLRGVRQLLAGGDALSVAHVERVLRELPGCRMINGYGPTESTTFTCCHGMSPGDPVGFSVPLGRPVNATRVYVLDAELAPVPLGVAGELCIGGDGLARGYLHRPGLTAERFVPDPWQDEPGTRLYRSGDRCRHLPDGRLEFLGRLDQQVKIRGFRIEPGEIEAALHRIPGICEAVVLAQAGPGGDVRLVAWVVPAKWPFDLAALRAALREKLPEYLVPSVFVTLSELPLTSHGKIDRAALPAPDREGESREAVPPGTAVEEKLAGIWQEVLGIARVGARDDFFELGGHSLMATRVASRVHKELGYELPLRVFYERPSLRELAAYVEEKLMSQLDHGLLAGMLGELEELSEAEVEALLAGESSGERLTANE
ncbi:MAG TPA: amino acid adenylation domain-containing protein [Thermoanaerobaculia bacterium]|nr:amino acid adenylation domain-containing protein [Thermoanaerobaculia bacterium]